MIVQCYQIIINIPYKRYIINKLGHITFFIFLRKHLVKKHKIIYTIRFILAIKY